MSIPRREVRTDRGVLYATCADGGTVRFSTADEEGDQIGGGFVLSRLGYAFNIELSSADLREIERHSRWYVDDVWHTEPEAMWRALSRLPDGGAATSSAYSLMLERVLPSLATWLNGKEAVALLEEGDDYQRTVWAEQAASAEGVLYRALDRVRAMQSALGSGLTISGEDERLLRHVTADLAPSALSASSRPAAEHRVGQSPAEQPTWAEQAARPLLRPKGATSPAPPGWQAVPAGTNDRGEDVEVVYDPRRYDVLVVHGTKGGVFPWLPHEDSPDLMLDALGMTGWAPHNFGGEPRVWIRDRQAAEQLAYEHREAGKQPEVQFGDLGPTRPYMRTEGPGLSIPPGWIAEPAGESGGVLMEVVYNPQRHDVMRVPHHRSEAVLDVLADEGWRSGGTDSSSHLLWRDRVEHARIQIERAGATPEVEIEGPGL